VVCAPQTLSSNPRQQSSPNVTLSTETEPDAEVCVNILIGSCSYPAVCAIRLRTEA